MSKEKSFEYKGIHLIYKKNKINKASDVSFGITTGAYQDGRHQGLAHLFEHCMFFGTKKHDFEEFKSMRETLCPSLNAATSERSMRMTFYESSRDLESILEFTSDQFFNSLPTESQFENEKKVISNEIARSQQQVKQKFIKANLKIIRDKKHRPLDVTGTSESLAKIKISDIKKFRQKWYKRQNFCFVIFTSVSLRKVKKLVDKYFLPYLEDDPNFVPFDYNITFENPSKVQFVHNKTSRLASIKISKLISSYSIANAVYLDAVSDCISFRLRELFREKSGLTYERPIFSYYQNKNGGYIAFTLKVLPENINKALDVTKQMFLDLYNNGFTQNDLDKLKLLEKRAKDVAEKAKAHGKATLMYVVYLERGKFSDTKVWRRTKKQINIQKLNDFVKEILTPNNVYVTIMADKKQKKCYSNAKILEMFGASKNKSLDKQTSSAQ